jgi:predicted pyridoxine 5'-phosphate oxidase superfamily flavin-nucleotide-binding protein
MNSDVAFSPAVKAEQVRHGSRAAYSRRDWPGEIPPDLAAYLADRDSIYFATSSKDGQPYVQHRGGPRGFLKILGPRTLAFADYAGNKQFITAGNLAENPRAFIFAMDYENQQRIKLWGKAHFSEDPALLEQFGPPPKRAKIERVLLFEVETWDANCHQHIPRKLDEDHVRELRERIAVLEEENKALRKGA